MEQLRSPRTDMPRLVIFDCDLFLCAARAMGVEPAACAVVEDTPSGVAAAVAAGMRVVGYAADSDERALRQAGAETLHSLGAVPRLLGLEG